MLNGERRNWASGVETEQAKEKENPKILAKVDGNSIQCKSGKGLEGGDKAQHLLLAAQC
jgi:hypothetical protein